MTKFSQMIQMPPRIVFVGWVLRPWTVLEAARLPPWWAAFWPCWLLVVTLLIRLVFFGRTSSCNWLFRWVSGSLQMIDDPDSMTEKPDAFGGRQSDFVKETLFGKGWLLTWRWIPHSIVHAIHVFDGWIYHDLPFFWPDSNCFRRQVLFRWSFGHQTTWASFRMRDRKGKSDTCSGTKNTIGWKQVFYIFFYDSFFCFCFFMFFLYRFRCAASFFKLQATSFLQTPFEHSRTSKACVLHASRHVVQT